MKTKKQAAKKVAKKKVVKKATSTKKSAPKKIKNVVKKVVTTTTVTTTTTINPKETHYLLILDESGSMNDVRKETLNGLNEQLQAIKNLDSKYDDQKYFVSITKFNSNISHLIENVAVADVKEFTESDYSPNSMTALYDAIGFGVNKLKEKIGPKLESGEASAFVVILTDGEENVSTKYTSDSIKQLITGLEKNGMWTFSFIGANQDAILAAKSIGVSASNSVGYTSSGVGSTLAFASMGATLSKRAMYVDNNLYAATTEGLLSEVTRGASNIGEDINLLDLNGTVSDDDLKKAAAIIDAKTKK